MIKDLLRITKEITEGAILVFVLTKGISIFVRFLDFRPYTVNS